MARGFITIADVRTQNNSDGLYFFDKGMNPISPWHSISLHTEDNEIPKFTTAKMEINTKLENNPIVQDVKKGKPRFYHGPIYWNYGALPQTWEDPNVRASDELENTIGDNDPIDVVEIGSTCSAPATGDILRVKVIGALALIDEGELDWKMIAIREGDELFDKINNISDLEAFNYGYIVSGVREWFRWYKTPDNKPVNRFGLKEQTIDAEESKRVIKETHTHYKNLMKGKIPSNGLWTKCPEDNSNIRF